VDFNANLTLKKHKNGLYCFANFNKKAFNLRKYEVLYSYWCKKYTIDNFTNRQPISGNVPGEITVINTFYND